MRHTEKLEKQFDKLLGRRDKRLLGGPSKEERRDKLENNKLEDKRWSPHH